MSEILDEFVTLGTAEGAMQPEATGPGRKGERRRE